MKATNAMRWIVALPAGLLAAVLVAFPVHWFVMVNFGGCSQDPVIEIRDPETLRNIEYFLRAVFGPLAFVYAAARTAPNFRMVVAVALSLVVVIGSPMAAFFLSNASAAAGRGVVVEYGLFTTLAQMVGTAGAVSVVYWSRRPAEAS